MKNYSEISVFLFIICAFGADGDEMKSVMEGDSVTLDTGFKERFNIIMWKFGFGYIVPLIAVTDGDEISYYTDKFRDRLKLNHQTGSLTVNNMRVLDSGHYEVRIEHNSRISYKKFIVTVHAVTNEEKTESAKSVALKTDTEIQTDDEKQTGSLKTTDSGDSDPQIKHRSKEKTESAKSVALKTDAKKQTDEEKLKLDHQTGSLKTTDSGDYKLQIKPCSEDEVNTIFVEEGNHVTLNPDAEIQRDDVTLWMFGDQHSLIALMSRSSRETFDGPDGRFRGRLKLDEKTGSLTITNIKSEHTGCYKLQITRSRGPKYKTFKVITHGE